MIKLIDVSIENYKSITGKPLDLNFSNFTTIVGPNNCGKSNILRAIQLFFNNEVDGQPYTPEIDFPQNPSLSHTTQTKITITLQYDPKKEGNITRSIEDIENKTDQTRLDNNLLRLRLSYSKKGVESWQFLGGKGARNIPRELIHRVRDSVLQSVRFKYLPVGRDSLENIQTEISEELVRTIFSGWSGAVQARKEINEAISELLERLRPRLQNTGDDITKSIQTVFSEIERLELRLPFRDLETMLPNLTPIVKDDYETGLKSKGAGIQTSSFLFLLKYLADNHPQRHNSRSTFIWAIEEPESFLHPGRQRGVAKILRDFSNDVQTIVATHCPHFVPREDNSKVYILDKDTKPPFSTIITANDYEQARHSLGVTLLDSMYLFPINLIVEGPSDEILLRGVLEKLYQNKMIDIDPGDVKFIPAGNANSACILFESLLNFVDSEETIVLLIIDGDDAGKKALNGLIKRNNANEIFLKANKDYFQLSLDIEELTSQRIIQILEQERPSQVNVVRDTRNRITRFSISDTQKRKVARRIIELIQREDLEKYKQVFQKIQNALTAKLG